MSEHQPTLDGLEPLSPYATALERAATAQLAYLDQQGLLGVQHSLTVALVRQAAAVAGAASASGKAAAFALASKELREAMALLPEATGPEDPWDRLQRELADAAAAQDREARHADGAAVSSDSTGLV
ncbi:hypothetical protein [Curtobacterium phage Penoan]|nr:hypothetical protein [Curtobacterium phage Penoan]